MELLELTMTVRVNGVTELELPTVNDSPLGTDANVRSTVFGCSVTLVVLVSPPESVAVSWSSMYDG